MSKRDEYVQRMRLQLDDLNAQVDRLSEKSRAASKEVQAKYHEEMADLRAQSRAANAKLEELKDAGEDAWEDLVSELEKVGQAFKKSYDYFKSQL